MIRYLSFKNGKVVRGNKLDYKSPGKNEFLFIFLTRPKEDEIKKVSKDFSFDPQPLQLYVRETHSRRYNTRPFQFVMRSTFLQKNLIGFSNLLFILMNRTLIVSAGKPSEFYDEIIEDLAESFDGTKVRSIGHILYNFMQEDVDENYEVLGQLEKRIKDVEARATRATIRQTKVQAEEILALKNQLFKLSRQFWATTRVISLIRIGVAQVSIDKESQRLLGDVHETFLHQIDLAATQKEMVSDVLNVYSTSLSIISAGTANELNIVVKKLTSYAALVLVPTLLASIYGMNFKVLPLSENPYGFWILLLIMVISTGWITYYFNKNDYL